MHTVDEPGRVPSGILALLVHLLFFGMLVFGVSWQKKVIGPVVVEIVGGADAGPQESEPAPEDRGATAEACCRR